MASRIYLSEPELNDLREFLAGIRVSTAMHRRWAAPPSKPAKFRAYVERMGLPENCSLLVRRKDTGRIVGVINISGIVHGLLRSGYLGYYVFAGYERQGFMREGIAWKRISAWQRCFYCAGQLLWLCEGRILPALPQDRRSLAGPRTVGNSCFVNAECSLCLGQPDEPMERGSL
ncbi:MAG: GNAT family N-acetyltransferase [Burkholderiales bacterium]